MITPALGRELQSVGKQVQGDLLEGPTIRRHLKGFPGQKTAQGDLSPVSLAAHQAQDSVHGLSGVEVFQIELVPLGLDLGHVEDVIDQLEQMRPGLMDHLGIIAIAIGNGTEQPLAHDVGKAHYGVQGRAQLMAHIGQEP